MVDEVRDSHICKIDIVSTKKIYEKGQFILMKT